MIRCAAHLISGLIFLWMFAVVILAQDVPVASPAASPKSSGTPSAKPPASEKQDSAKDAASSDDKKEGEEKSDDKPASSVIKRTEYQPEPLEEEPELNPDPDGKVRFSFHGAKWPTVLNWLAKFSQLNLDWQELPGDFLNLRTQHSYTATEARDVINRHLLARGYTLLKHDELLTVVKVKGIDPGLVPRVEPDELQQRTPHEFVKVSLPLDWILAEEAVEQLKPMLSQNGKLSAIAAVNRLEAMDEVANLQEIYKLLSDEQSQSHQENGLVRVFKLKYVRASIVIDSLYAILGVRKPDAPSGGGNLSSGSSMQIMQQLQQMQQQMQRSSGGGANSGGSKEATEPRLVLNERENSILAHASPDKMEIIEQTITAIDVESTSTSHILQNLDKMKVYRLSTLKPQPLVQILSEIGDLSPTVKIQIDEDNNSIILYGTLADHVTVSSLVDKLDGSSRSFEVIPLRRVNAAEVAGTIQYMLGEEEKKEDESRSRYSYYGYSSYRSADENKKDDRPFKVEADIERNRLLVWANEQELEEVENLLSKMGEIKPGQSNPATARMLDLHSQEQAQQILERLQETWKQNRANELKIDLPSEEAEPDPENPDLKKEARLQTVNRIRHATDEIITNGDSEAPKESVHPLLAEADPAIDSGGPSDEELLRRFRELTNDLPEVNIRQLEDGRLYLESKDTQALDELEMLISELIPPAPNYKVYRIKYAYPYWIELLLDDFFASDEDEETFLDWYGYAVTTNKDTPSRLSSKRKLKIISDDESMTLLVQNATYEQLGLIEDLLEIYDRPESSDPQSIRVTKHFELEYSKAAVIAETLKAVYRDLLSSNDPALQNKNQEGKSQPVQQGITYTYVRGGSSGEEEGGKEREEPIRFKGLLSVGIDDISNTIVVSAASGLMEDISNLIEKLDEAAKPDLHVRVAPVNPSIDATLLRDRLNQSFGFQSKIGVSSTTERGQENPNQQNPQQQGNQSQNNGQFNGTQGSN